MYKASSSPNVPKASVFFIMLQAAALAEFRADWATAVRTYQAAYTELLRVDPAGPLPLQRWAELSAVAELVHLKVRVLCPLVCSARLCIILNQMHS